MVYSVVGFKNHTFCSKGTGPYIQSAQVHGSRRPAKARRVTDLIVRSRSDNEPLAPNSLRCLITTPTSQKVEYLGKGSLLLNTSLSIRDTNGCYPTGEPSISEWTDEIAE